MEQPGAASRQSRERPYFLTPEVERVLMVTMTLAQELAVARARVDTLERLLERKGVLTRAEVEAFEPTAAEAAESRQSTQEYVARVLGVLARELEQMESDRGGGAGSGASASPTSSPATAAG